MRKIAIAKRPSLSPRDCGSSKSELAKILPLIIDGILNQRQRFQLKRPWTLIFLPSRRCEFHRLRHGFRRQSLAQRHVRMVKEHLRMRTTPSIQLPMQLNKFRRAFIDRKMHHFGRGK